VRFTMYQALAVGPSYPIPGGDQVKGDGRTDFFNIVACLRGLAVQSDLDKLLGVLLAESAPP
jgi:hypothetical protein